MLLTITRSHMLTLYLLLVEIGIYIMLLSDHNYYTRHSQPIEISKILLIIASSFGLLLIVTTVRIYSLKEELFSIKDISSAHSNNSKAKEFSGVA